MKYEPNLLNPDQEVHFGDAMRRWQRLLNLDDWRIERGRRRPVRSMAEVKMDYAARLATYRTGDFGDPSDPIELVIEQTALHESIHILLFELIHLASIGAEASLLQSVEHRVVTTLEKLLIGTAP